MNIRNSGYSLSDIAYDQPKTVRRLLEALYIATGKDVSVGEGNAWHIQKSLLRCAPSLENEMAKIDRIGIDNERYESLKAYVNTSDLSPNRKGVSVASTQLAQWINRTHAKHTVKLHIEEAKKYGRKAGFNTELLEFLNNR